MKKITFLFFICITFNCCRNNSCSADKAILKEPKDRQIVVANSDSVFINAYNRLLLLTSTTENGYNEIDNKTLSLIFPKDSVEIFSFEKIYSIYYRSEGLNECFNMSGVRNDTAYDIFGVIVNKSPFGLYYYPKSIWRDGILWAEIQYSYILLDEEQISVVKDTFNIVIFEKYSSKPGTQKLIRSDTLKIL